MDCFLGTLFILFHMADEGVIVVVTLAQTTFTVEEDIACDFFTNCFVSNTGLIMYFFSLISKETSPDLILRLCISQYPQ
ncbi:uncharacterized protein BX663DRAFT_513239 [Cokeromyces recurvatus]|uniref:uncharacterized protein n=1 Tax=Cokeromyces recurvatus TaxID=90255 RepID=UPI00221EF4C6|nr:uncharacterized protein BX663DRAFT_513239 [Cokeromyces recurvatus]KAI7902018.1 hypothetical protein BX663DRAFT_513239 [Cokeromyces recurvatus]